MNATRRQTPPSTRSHDPQQAPQQKNTAGGFNPLWYFNKLRNQSRHSRHCARNYCLSGFPLREPELCGGWRVSASAGLSISVWHLCQPPSQRGSHFVLSAGTVQCAGSGIPSSALLTFLLQSSSAAKGPFEWKLEVSAFFILSLTNHFRQSTLAAESPHAQLKNTTSHG